MANQSIAPPRFMVSVRNDPNTPETLQFNFDPKGLQQPRSLIEPMKPIPSFALRTETRGNELSLEWIRPPVNESTKADLEEIARERVAERAAWIQRVSDLVKSVEAWAKELGWVTKRIEKKIEDSRLGNHKVAALVMQEDTVRVLLEPIAAATPGTSGLVDLCLMPGYDDIASFYHRADEWKVQYVFPTERTQAGLRARRTRPLSKESLRNVLDEMKAHAE